MNNQKNLSQVLYLVLLMTLFVSSSYSQIVSDKPFKKFNIIQIETGLSPKDAYLKWGKHLAQNAFEITKTDETFLIITTGARAVKYYDYILNTSVLDSGRVQIKIRWSVKTKNSYSDWKFRDSSLIETDKILSNLTPILEAFGKVYYLQFD